MLKLFNYIFKRKFWVGSNYFQKDIETEKKRYIKSIEEKGYEVLKYELYVRYELI